MMSKACLFILTRQHLETGAGLDGTPGSLGLYVGVSGFAWRVTHVQLTSIGFSAFTVSITALK